MDKFKTTSFSIREDLLEEFRREVKKSPYNQKYVINNILEIAIRDLKALNEQSNTLRDTQNVS